MSQAILESIHPTLAKVKATEQSTILESIEKYAQDKVAKVEEEYAEKFNTLTESISTTFVDMVEKSIDNATNNILQNTTITTLTESLHKVKAVFEEIGMKINDPSHIDIDGEIDKSDTQLKKAVDLMRRAEEILAKAKKQDEEVKIKVAIIDATREGINWTYISEKTGDASPLETLVERVLSSGATLDNCIEKAQSYLSKLMGEVELNASLAPKETDLQLEYGLNEDSISSELSELEKYVDRGGARADIRDYSANTKLTHKFESSDPLGINVPAFEDRLARVTRQQTLNGRMDDVSTAQLECVEQKSMEVVRNFSSDQPEVMQAMNSIKSLKWNL